VTTLRAHKTKILRRAAHLGAPRAPLEDMEQRRLAHYLDAIGVLWCHVPNGGRRGKIEAARLVGQGVKAGVPDVLIFEAVRRWPPPPTRRTVPLLAIHPTALIPIGIALEMKRRDATLSAVSAAQRAWGLAMSERGWYCFAARGADEAIDEMERLGFSR